MSTLYPGKCAHYSAGMDEPSLTGHIMSRTSPSHRGPPVGDNAAMAKLTRTGSRLYNRGCSQWWEGWNLSMKDLLCDEFQEAVGESLVRHKSILDVLTKFQESNARVNRAIVKSVTNCGCVRVTAERQRIPSDISLHDLPQFMDSHLAGELCEHCKDVIESEIGANMFYLAALCNLLDLNLYDVLIKERKRLSALGIFNFSD